MTTLSGGMSTTGTAEITPLPLPATTHALSDAWTLWGHATQNNNWTLSGYDSLAASINTVEQAVAVMESLPDALIKNSMLFLMRDNIKPTWEDPRNEAGGCFSYRVNESRAPIVWRELSYVIMGGTVSKNAEFIQHVTGIEISPKKGFCIVKIWMTNCRFQNASLVTEQIKEISPRGCIFTKHEDKKKQQRK